MDINSKLKITYKSYIDKNKSLLHEFTIYVEAEKVLMRNTRFSQIPLSEQLKYVDEFIREDRIRYNNKEFFDRSWIPEPEPEYL